MPGVLMVEALAQAGAVAVLAAAGRTAGKLALFAGIDDVRFKRIVGRATSSTLDVRARGACAARSAAARRRATVGGELAVRGTLTFARRGATA